MGHVARALRVSLVLAAIGLAAIAPSAGAYVYFASGSGSSMTVSRANLDGSDVNYSFMSGFSSPIYGLAADNSYIYIAEGDTIGRAHLDGTSRDDSFISTVSARDVTVDGNYIYWTENVASGGIARANLDGSGVNHDFIKANAPYGVAVGADHVYWSNWTAPWGIDMGTTVGRAKLDGTEVNQAFVTGAQLPQGIAVDASHIYWANTQWPLVGRYGAIGRASLLGSDPIQDFMWVSACGVDVDSKFLYWAETSNTTSTGLPLIGRANLDGTDGDLNFIRGTGSGSCAIAVDALGPTPTTTTVSSSPSTSTYGQGLKFTATVAASTGTATGKVSFTVTGEPPVSVDLDASRAATYAPPYYLDVGDSVTAEYKGDAAHEPSSATIHPDIKPAPTSVGMTMPNPMIVGRDHVTIFTVRNEATTITPFGSVALEIDGYDLGSASLDESGQVVGILTPTEPGYYSITVRYHDDTGSPPDFIDSQSTAVVHVIAATPVPATPAAPPVTVTPQGGSPPAQVVLGTKQTSRVCTVPRTKRLKLAAAKRKLRRAGCRLGTVAHRKAKRALRGRVILSKPAAGRKTSRPVTLVVGR